MSQQCPQCQAPLKPNAQFCGKCGVQVTHHPPPLAAEAPSDLKAPRPVPLKAPSATPSIRLPIMLVFALVGAGIGMLAGHFTHNDYAGRIWYEVLGAVLGVVFGAIITRRA